jgi:hypothetical protein
MAGATAARLVAVEAVALQ